LLAACGGDDADSGSKGKGASEGTIRVLMQTQGDAIGPKKGMAQWKAKNPDVKVVIDEVPGNVIYQRLLANFTSPKGRYDVVEVYPVWLGDFASAGHLENLDTFFEKNAQTLNLDDYLDVERNKIDDSWYAVPFDNDVNVFYYRSDLFNDAKNKTEFKEQHGEDLAPPQTWDQVLNIATFFKGKGIDGFTTVAARSWYAVGFWFNVYGSYGGKLQQNGKPTLDEKAFLQANDMYVKLLETAAQGIGSFDYTESRAALIEGKAAQGIQWATTAITAETAPNVELGVVTMPGVEQADGNILRTPALPYGKALTIPKNAPNKELGFKYAAFLSSPEMQKVCTLAASGIDPNRASVFEDPEVKKAWESMIPAITESLPIGVPDMDVPNAKQYYEVISGALSAIWTKQLSAEDGYRRVIDGWKDVRPS
jgi:multiple sugar transport system substrate-binding protein